MLSLKFGSGPSSCMYSSCGSSRTAMRGTVLDRSVKCRRRPPGGASTRAASGVAALSPLVDGITYTGRPPSRRSCQPAAARRSTAARQPARPTKHTAAGLQPRAQPVEALDAGAVLVAREGVGPRRRPLHEVGHADAVVAEGVAGVAVAGDEPGREGGGPEAVAGGDVADPGVGGVHARVQPAHEQAHPGARRGPGASRPRVARTVKPWSPDRPVRSSRSSSAKPAPWMTSRSRSSVQVENQRPGKSSSGKMPRPSSLAAEERELDGCARRERIGAGRRARSGRRRRGGGRRCCGPSRPARAPRRNGRAEQVGLHAEGRRARPRGCAAPWRRAPSSATTGAPSAAVYQPGPQPRSTATPGGRRAPKASAGPQVRGRAAALVVGRSAPRRSRRWRRSTGPPCQVARQAARERGATSAREPPGGARGGGVGDARRARAASTTAAERSSAMALRPITAKRAGLGLEAHDRRCPARGGAGSPARGDGASPSACRRRRCGSRRGRPTSGDTTMTTSRLGVDEHVGVGGGVHAAVDVVRAADRHRREVARDRARRRHRLRQERVAARPDGRTRPAGRRPGGWRRSSSPGGQPGRKPSSTWVRSRRS